MFRKRSAGSVVDEIERCVSEFRVEEFVVYDDTFTVDRARVLEICRLIGERACGCAGTSGRAWTR